MSALQLRYHVALENLVLAIQYGTPRMIEAAYAEKIEAGEALFNARRVRR